MKKKKNMKMKTKMKKVKKIKKYMMTIKMTVIMSDNKFQLICILLSVKLIKRINDFYLSIID